MIRQYIKKADIVLAAALLICGILGFVFLQTDADDNAVVEITVDGSIYKTVSLNTDTSFEVNTSFGKNIIVTDNHRVCVEDADCEGRDCVEFGWIEKEGQVIMCLPHRMIVTIKGGGEIDASSY